jgi:hypothetical protein
MPVQPAVAPHTIVLRGDLHKRHEEAVAAADIKPGYIIKKDGTGKVIPHNAAGGGGQMWVAKEETLTGGLRAGGGTITDHVYLASEADVVFYHMPQPGDLLYCRVAAGAVAIPIDSPVTSAGNGTLKKATGGDAVFGYNGEGAIVDNSGGTGDIFMRVEIP